VPAGDIGEVGAVRSGGGPGEAVQEGGGGAIVGDGFTGAAGPGQLGPVGLHAQAEGVQRGRVAGVGVDQGDGLGHLLPGPLQVAAAQGQLGQAGEQGAGSLGLGDRGRDQPLGGPQPGLGGVEVAQAQVAPGA
jgi:hypothetical protein